jgi:hypothetical protein
LALLRRLMPAQQRYGSRHLTTSKNDGLFFQGCMVHNFFKIDLRKGYFQPAAIGENAIIGLFRLFEFLHLTFSLKNAGNTFQQLMDQVLAGLAFAFIYSDDIIIASPSHEQHQRDI